MSTLALFAVASCASSPMVLRNIAPASSDLVLLRGSAVVSGRADNAHNRSPDRWATDWTYRIKVRVLYFGTAPSPQATFIQRSHAAYLPRTDVILVARRTAAGDYEILDATSRDRDVCSFDLEEAPDVSAAVEDLRRRKVVRCAPRAKAD